MARFSSHSHQSRDYKTGSTTAIFRELSEVLESNRLFIQQEKSEIDKLQEEISGSLKSNVHLVFKFTLNLSIFTFFFIEINI